MSGKLTYKIGDALNPEETGRILIPHVTNSLGTWGRGFVVAVSKKYPEAERAYRKWFKYGGSSWKMGQVQEVKVTPDISVINMMAQNGYISYANPVPLDYEALEECMVTTAGLALDSGAMIVAPRFGSQLAGGNWTQIEKMIQKLWVERGIDVTIYSLPG